MKIVIIGACPSGAALLLPTLRALHARRPITRINHGCTVAWGVPVEAWASNHRVPTHCDRANWNLYGRRAPEYRNQAILNDGRPDLPIVMSSGVEVGRMKVRAQLRRIPAVIPGFDSARQAAWPAARLSAPPPASLHRADCSLRPQPLRATV